MTHEAPITPRARIPLAPGLEVWRASTSPLYRTGSSDHRVTLGVAQRCDGKGLEPYLSTNGDPMLVTFADDVWSVGVHTVAQALGLSVDMVIQLVKTKIPNIDWPGASSEARVDLSKVPIRARGQAAIDIARAESSPDEPLWLSAMRATGVRDGERCLTIEEAEKIHATDPDAIFLTVGRVGWCVVGSAFGRERVVEGPFRTRDEALAAKKPWDVVRFRCGFEATTADFRVGLRHTPETFWHMVRRLDAERQAAKQSR